jgi:hypothetical protein
MSDRKPQFDVQSVRVQGSPISGIAWIVGAFLGGLLLGYWLPRFSEDAREPSAAWATRCNNVTQVVATFTHLGDGAVELMAPLRGSDSADLPVTLLTPLRGKRVDHQSYLPDDGVLSVQVLLPEELEAPLSITAVRGDTELAAARAEDIATCPNE